MNGRSDSEEVVTVKKPRGRPRTFDKELAVKKAMLLFWEYGYEGTSYEMLLNALGIRPSSFQNAFGTKEDLYRLAVDHYLREATAWFSQVLDAPGDTREVFRKLVKRSALAFVGGEYPTGCMISVSATQIGPGALPIRSFGTDIRRLSESALEARILKGIASGDVPKTTDAQELASYFGTVFRGMAVQARDGVPLESLNKIGERAMLGWPVDTV